MNDAPGAETFHVPAEAYDRHVGRYGRELGRMLCACAEVQPGGSALDVGCGTGALTAALVDALGPDRVSAVDPSPQFVAACRERFPDVRVEEAQAERLPFGDAAFDHALAQLVVNFMADATAGVREMRRVTRDGGTVAAAVWDYAGEMRLLRCFWDAATEVDPAAARRDERDMPYCTPPELETLWADSGMEGRVVPIVVNAHYDDFEDLWAPIEQGAGPSGAYAASLDDAHRAELRGELRRRLGVSSDAFELSARAWVISGRAEARR
jgi:SAM-dependent methyltransferase